MVWATEDDGRTERESGGRTGELICLASALVLVVILVAFSFANTHRTKVDLVVGEVWAPLVVVLLATAVAGALISALVRFQHRHSH